MSKSDCSVLDEAYQSLDDSEKKRCDALANLFSIVVTADALHNEYIEGRIPEDIYTPEIKSLTAQFSNALNSSQSYTTKEQFFRDYFGTDEYKGGMSALENRGVQLKEKEIKANDAFSALEGSNRTKIKGGIKKQVEVLRTALRDLFNYARVSFDFDTALNDIVKICDTDTCDENAAFNNPSYHNRIYNILRSLKKEYDDKLLLMKN